jgi:zinc transport system substrate-binding protein
VAKDKAEVLMLIPFGKDIHSYEPTPKDRASLQKSTIFFYSGGGLEPWADQFEHHNRIDMSHHVRLNALSDDEDKHEEHHEEHHHIMNDPHYWLSIDNMIVSAETIADVLSKIYPNSKLFFQSNAAEYIVELKKVQKEYKRVLSTCKNDVLAVNHNAFGYLSSEYGFHVKSLSGFSTDALPSAQSMKDLINTVKEHHISMIFFEPFSSDRLMQTVANESNTTVTTLHPLANITREEAAQKKSYVAIMRENLHKLSRALVCE